MKRGLKIALVVLGVLVAAAAVAEPLSSSGVLPKHLGRGAWIFRAISTTTNAKIADFKTAGGVSKASIDIEGDAIVHDLSITGSLTPPLDYVNFATGLTVATDAAEFATAGDLRIGTSGASNFTVAAATGNTVVAGTSTLTGDVAIGSNKFNVVATNGNTQIDGTLDVDGAAVIDGAGTVTGNLKCGDSKFDVTAASGNTQIDGTLDVDGAGDIDGALNVDGAITGPSLVLSASSGTTALTAIQSGALVANTGTSGTTTFTLPTAAAGLRFCFVEAGDAAGELLINPFGAASDVIVGKTHAANDGVGIATAANAGIKNTAGTNVKGDFVCLSAIDATTWVMTSEGGVWAAQ